MALSDVQKNLLIKIYGSDSLSFDDAAIALSDEKDFLKGADMGDYNDVIGTSFFSTATVSALIEAPTTSAFTVFIAKYTSQIINQIETGGVQFTELQLVFNFRNDFFIEASNQL